jgi:Mn-containing catalase
MTQRRELLVEELQDKRLKRVFELLDERPQPKHCRAKIGLVEECAETIAESTEKEVLAADLALITPAQKVEHYEISRYGTARALARQIGEFNVATLLSNTWATRRVPTAF